MKPVASIIVLTYNSRPYLDSCLSSLLDQSVPADEYEVIVADNGSSDGSADYVAAHYPAVHVLRFEHNYGFAEGNNRAAQAAGGRYLGFQNVDTVAHHNWLGALLKAITSDPEVKACHPAALPLNGQGQHERHAFIPRGYLSELNSLGCVAFRQISLAQDPFPTLFLAGGSALIDRTLSEELPYIFDPTFFLYNEDTDLGLRINNLGYKVLFVPTAVAYHERHPSRRLYLNRGNLRRAYLVNRNRYLTFYKNMTGPEFLLTVPLLCLGSLDKAWGLDLDWTRRAAYTLGVLPFTLLTLLLAAIHFPAYRHDRRAILSRRAHGRFWLLRELWRRRNWNIEL
ncbi:MAG: glycosyltransferase family 2 protein [Chloroflexota bacterium]